jgi:hypothetical protein
MNDLKTCFYNSPYGSTKHSHYFEIYEQLFSTLNKKNITLIEVGVLNGGSLFMWKNYFGKTAKIIGVDLNPEAKKWEKHGFDIYIGDQNCPTFWEKTLKRIGQFDVFIDDGGHTNRQQANTLKALLEHNNNDSLIIFEDTHASYQAEFGNPSIFSFVNLSKKLIDFKHSSKKIKPMDKLSSSKISSIEYFDSIIAIKMKKNIKQSKLVFNKAFKKGAVDFRHNNIYGYKFLHQIIKSRPLKVLIKWCYYKFDNLKLMCFFKRF